MKNAFKIFVMVAGMATLYSCGSEQNAANEAEAPVDSVETPAADPAAPAVEDTTAAPAADTTTSK